MSALGVPPSPLPVQMSFMYGPSSHGKIVRAGAAFDFLRPILVVVRLPQIEREGKGEEGGPHAHSKRRRGDNPRKEQQDLKCPYNFDKRAKPDLISCGLLAN